MFFARRDPGKNPPAKQFGTRSSAAASAKPSGRPAPTPPPVPPVKTPRVVPVPKQEQVVITRYEDVPKGRYVPFKELEAEDTLRLSFAVLLTGIDAQRRPIATILACEDTIYTHPRFALEEKVKASWAVATVALASREVIEAIHTEGTGSKVVEGETDVEAAAWSIVQRALDLKASDIHMFTRDAYAEVFFRINGRFVQQPDLSKTLAEKMGSVLYGVHADADGKAVNWDPKKPQDAAIDKEFEGPNGTKRLIHLRFASGPIFPSGNFDITMRVQDMSASYVALDSVGYTDEMEAVILRILVGRGGVFLVGPTNSGKSRSMVSFILTIQETNGPKTMKVMTIEKPVEFLIPHAVQISVKDDVEFKANMKSILRRDADVVLVGEIRDEAETEIVKDMILTGRKLLTSVHVTNAMTTFTRLREMGVPESVLYSPDFVSGIIFQRLVPVLCDCSLSVEEAKATGSIEDALFERLSRVADVANDKIRFARVGGCPKCLHTGIVGRTACAEVLKPSPEFLRLMRKGDEEGARREWEASADLNVDGRGVTALAHAIRKMRQGQVDPRHVEKEIESLDSAPDFMGVANLALRQPGPVAVARPISIDQDTTLAGGADELPPALRH